MADHSRDRKATSDRTWHLSLSCPCQICPGKWKLGTLGRGGLSIALVCAPYPTNLYFTIKHEGFCTVLFSFQVFFSKFSTSILTTQCFTAHSCNFVRLLRYLFSSSEVFAKKTFKSINKLIFSVMCKWIGINMKPLGKKFSPRAEFRLLRCLSVIIFPLAAPRCPGDNITPRSPHKRGSCFPDSC